MSSPIAKQDKSALDLALISAHKTLSHSRRIEQLAAVLAARIQASVAGVQGRVPRLLDVGCGDMTLVDALSVRLPGVDFSCVDIHPCPPEVSASDPRWRRYTQFDGRTLPFADGSFDVVMFVDVLHHVPPDLRVGLLTSAAVCGASVVIKDHFEYGWWSRQALRAMDFVGNFGYGVSVPERYFDQHSFQDLCGHAGLTVQRMDVGISLYNHLPVARHVLSPRWQFVASGSRR